MLTHIVNDARTRFGVVSPYDHEAMRRFHADRLRGTTAQAAAKAGLTQQGLERLLADES